MNRLAFILILCIPALVLADGYVVAARQGDLTVLVPDQIVAGANLRVSVVGRPCDDIQVALSPVAGTRIDVEYCGQRAVLNARAIDGVAFLTPPTTGEWTLDVFARRGSETTTISCTLRVEPARSLATIWPYLAISPIAIVLFAMNQMLRTKGSRTCQQH